MTSPGFLLLDGKKVVEFEKDLSGEVVLTGRREESEPREKKCRWPEAEDVGALLVPDAGSRRDHGVHE